MPPRRRTTPVHPDGGHSKAEGHRETRAAGYPRAPATVPHCHDRPNMSTNLRTSITTLAPSMRLDALLSLFYAVPSPPIDCCRLRRPPHHHRGSTNMTFVDSRVR
ncbi:hypothetical protein C0995_011076, partial [Termitomyces sp. Mi166